MLESENAETFGLPSSSGIFTTGGLMISGVSTSILLTGNGEIPSGFSGTAVLAVTTVG
jgi:hypothetical protein